MWLVFFFFKQKTAYEMRISDWSSDVCSSDLDRTSSDFPAGSFPPERVRTRPAGSGGGDAHDGPVPGDQAGASGRPAVLSHGRLLRDVQIGRASCRERVCQSV